MSIERTAVGYLTGLLEVPVYGEVPERMPERFVTVEKTGGARRNYIWTATLAIQSWAGSMDDAMDLSGTVVEAMLDAPKVLSSVAAIRLNSEYNWTDPDTMKYRYQAVFDITHYG